MAMAINDENGHKKVEFLGTNSTVEVSRGNNGAWYVAKILSSYHSSFNNKHKFLVQYQTMLSQFHSNDFLTECVDSASIRPLPPPPAADRSYEPLDIVDALHRGGWRKGVVCKVGVLEENSKSKGYIVEFSNPPEKFLFCSANLRPHLDWTNGNWVSPPQLKASPNRTQFGEQSAFAENSSKNPLGKSIPFIATSTSGKPVSPVPETEEILPNYSKEFEKENSANPSSTELCHMTSETAFMESTELATDSAIANLSTSDSGENLPLAGSNNLDKGSYADANQQEAGEEKGVAGTFMKRKGEWNSQVTDEHFVVEVGENKTKENRFEVTQKGNVDNLDQSSALSVQAESELVKNHKMPFTKSSLFWQFIDSLQVFQVLPQQPHFRPLLDLNEETCEGLAIGHMLNFANLVEMASKLQIEHPTSLFETYVEALADHEMLGFDVKAVVNRINKLVSIKTRQEQLHCQSKEIQSKIARCAAEEAEMGEDIDAIDEIIKELEAQRAMEVSRKVKLESSRNILQMNVERIDEDISNAKQDFESLAVSHW